MSGEAENNKKFSSYWMMDATYLRLKNITLGYTLPKSVSNKLKIRSCRIFITGLNILTFDNVYPLDPEASISKLNQMLLLSPVETVDTISSYEELSGRY